LVPTAGDKNRAPSATHENGVAEGAVNDNEILIHVLTKF